MYKATFVNGNWVLPNEIYFDRQVVVYFNFFLSHLHTIDSSNFNVLGVFAEPEYFRDSNGQVVAHKSKFNLILANDPVILRSCSNATFMPFGGNWVLNEDASQMLPDQKKFKISFICGSKTYTEGHHLRHRIWARQKEITTPREFWISKNAPVAPVDNNPMFPERFKKDALFRDSQFHVCVENVKQPGYFSEKICDAFVTRTIPIYWGCPDIGKYFDPKGIITFSSDNDLIRICNGLSADDYAKKIVHVENNYRAIQGMSYNALGTRIHDKIQEFLVK